MDGLKVDNVLSEQSHDADTPTVGSERVRIKGVDGSEINKTASGLGSNVLRIAGVKPFDETKDDAEYMRDGLFSIFGGQTASVDSDEKGKFGRTLSDITLDGDMSWRQILHEVGVSDTWSKYGVDVGEDKERFK